VSGASSSLPALLGLPGLALGSAFARGGTTGSSASSWGMARMNAL
jgi:hypothetical protein